MATAQPKQATGTAAVAQRAIRQGGGKPAPSDTVNAKLTPGETVIPKELSEQDLAPLVALYQQQGKLSPQDIEQYLYPILQNLQAGGAAETDGQGMSCGGRVGFEEGGWVGGKDIEHTSTKAMADAAQAWVSQQPDSTLFDRVNAGKTYDTNHPLYDPNVSSVSPPRSSSSSLPLQPKENIYDYFKRIPNTDGTPDPNLSSPAAMAIHQKEVAKSSPGMTTYDRMNASGPYGPGHTFYHPDIPAPPNRMEIPITPPDKPKPAAPTAKATETKPTETKPADPIGDTLLGKSQEEGEAPKYATVVDSQKQVHSYRVDGDGQTSRIVNGQAVPMAPLNILPAGASLQHGSDSERAMERVNALQGETFLGKQYRATAAEKLALYNGLMNAAQGGGGVGGAVQAVAQPAYSGPTQWQQEVAAHNARLSGPGRAIDYLTGSLETGRKRSTANALAEMWQIQNADQRTQVEKSLGQQRNANEAQGHQLAADVGHERNAIESQGQQLGAVERLAMLAKGQGRERQENMQANLLEAINNAKTPEEQKSLLERYQAVFGGGSRQGQDDWHLGEIQTGTDATTGLPTTASSLVNRRTGEIKPANLPQQPRQPSKDEISWLRGLPPDEQKKALALYPHFAPFLKPQ